MSLVFPNALAARTTNVALARGAFWFGMVCLAAAFSTVGLIMLDRSRTTGLPALAALLVIAAAGVLLELPAGRRPAVLAIAAGAALAGNALYASILLPALEAFDSTDTVLLSLPTMAIIVFGAMVAPRYSAVTGVLVAAVIAQAPVVVASLAVGRAPAPDIPALICLIALLLTLGLLKASRDRTRASEPAISRASLDDVAAIEEARVEHITSALVHDTILNELAVIGTVAPGVLSEAAREHVRSSIQRLRPGAHYGLPDSDVLGGDVAAAVEQARARGLTVTVGGEVTAVDSLDARTSEALGLAVLQCLTNVAAHAGTDKAELTVIATETEVCVMVIDSGSGFVEAEVDHDRLGVRQSVRGRIADVGGSVQLWTSPGSGSAVSMRVPRS
jgi:two-component sensor histidine kinase